MKKIFLTILLTLSYTSSAKENPNELLDGLHRDAHEGNFQNYFARYTADAIFLGTDKTERWTIEEFKAYAEVPFADAVSYTHLTLPTIYSV